MQRDDDRGGGGSCEALSVAAASSGMVSYRVVVPASDVVFVKGVVEASDGLGVVFSDSGGELFISSPTSRENELVVLLADLTRELDAEAPSRTTRPDVVARS
jgi:hypothetical protein